MPCRASCSERLAVRRHRHPVVRARRDILALQRVCASVDGRVLSANPRNEPVSVCWRWPRVPASVRPDSRPWSEVRNPRHAWHPETGRARQLTDQGLYGWCASGRLDELDVRMEHRHVRGQRTRPRRAGLLRLSVRVVRAVGCGLRQGRRHPPSLRGGGNRAHQGCYRRLRSRNGPQPVLRSCRHGSRRPPASTCPNVGACLETSGTPGRTSSRCSTCAGIGLRTPAAAIGRTPTCFRSARLRTGRGNMDSVSASAG